MSRLLDDGFFQKPRSDTQARRLRECFLCLHPGRGRIHPLSLYAPPLTSAPSLPFPDNRQRGRTLCVCFSCLCVLLITAFWGPALARIPRVRSFDHSITRFLKKPAHDALHFTLDTSPREVVYLSRMCLSCVPPVLCQPRQFSQDLEHKRTREPWVLF